VRVQVCLVMSVPLVGLLCYSNATDTTHDATDTGTATRTGTATAQAQPQAQATANNAQAISTRATSST
jgi:hypothetical protein